MGNPLVANGDPLDLRCFPHVCSMHAAPGGKPSGIGPCCPVLSLLITFFWSPVKKILKDVISKSFEYAESKLTDPEYYFQ